MRGLTLEECESSKGTFDAGCKKVPKAAEPVKAPDEDSEEGLPCCHLLNGKTVKGLSFEVCDEANGEYDPGCEI